jgi:hypothetical protein
MISEKFNEEFANHINQVNSTVYRLRGLSDAFFMTGNERMAEKLEYMAADLQKSAECVRGSYGQAVTDAVRQTEQATNNMMRACLAGLTGGK